jgi:ABC-2 type transport system permease protein
VAVTAGTAAAGAAARVLAHLRTVAVAGRLGLQMEANWTRAGFFTIYSLVRPIAMSLIIIVMYFAAKTAGPATLAYMFVGNAFYIYVGNVLLGVSQVVIEDREHYQMLKYVYTAPISIYAYLLGRGLTKVGMATLAVIVTLVFGFIALPGLSFDLGVARIGLLLVTTALGVTGLVFLGIVLAGIALNVARHGMMWSEGIAGVLYVLTGAVFPPDVLPRWLHPVSQALPITYWLELSRRALLGPGPAATQSKLLAGLSDGALLLVLAGSTAAFGVVSIFFYRKMETIARRKSRIDQITSF